MAQPYVTGPAHLYVGLGASFAPLYLGTAERTPRIEIRPAWDAVFNDIAGGKIPLDWLYEGEEAFVTADVTRWNEPVYTLLSARPRTSTAGAVQGQNVPGDIGTLLISENFAFPLWIQFPYVGKAAMAAGNLPPGYRFIAAWLEGPDDLDNLGTMARKTRLVFHCGRAYALSTNAAGGGMTFTLYDHNMTGLPQIN